MRQVTIYGDSDDLLTVSGLPYDPATQPDGRPVIAWQGRPAGVEFAVLGRGPFVFEIGGRLRVMAEFVTLSGDRRTKHVWRLTPTGDADTLAEWNVQKSQSPYCLHSEQITASVPEGTTFARLA